MFMTIYTAILAILFLIIVAPIYLALRVYARFQPEKAGMAGQAVIACGLRLLIGATFTKVDVRGLENVPKDGPVLFVSNHRSNVDSLIGYAYVSKPTGFVAKIEIKKIPYVSAWMELLHCLFLDRKDNRQGLKVILQAIEYVKKGYSMWICPEGTRMREGGATETLEFHSGSFKIASKAGCPVVPVAFYGTREMLEDHMPKLRPGRVVMSFGEPVIIEELDEEIRRNIGEHFRGIIGGMLRQIDSERR